VRGLRALPYVWYSVFFGMILLPNPNRLTVNNIKELSKLYTWWKMGGGLMGSESVTVSLPEELNKRLERYIEKHYRAYITGRGLKAEIIEEALSEWLDKRGG